MRRVLVGTFVELVRVGLRDALRDESIVVIDLDNENLFQGVVELLPDVVVVDRDLDVSEDLVDKITSAFPSMKVLDCSVENTTMRVYPPFHQGESYECALDLDRFTQAVLT